MIDKANDAQVKVVVPVSSGMLLICRHKWNSDMEEDGAFGFVDMFVE
jgi:hypothetical protein